MDLKKYSLYLLVMLLTSSCGWLSNRYKPNVEIKGESKVFVNIPTQIEVDSIVQVIEGCECIMDIASFEKAAKDAELGHKYKPGRYELTDGMTNKDIINLLKSGRQTPVKVTFNSVRTLENLAGKLNGKLEVDSAGLMKYWTNKALMKERYGLEPEEVPALFLPNTYEFYWNTDAEEFTDKMQKEFKKFWTDERKSKAEKLGLTPVKVIILASIVQSEQTSHKEEWPIIARLYLNRLNKGMMLQADPTVIFAMGDFTITRVLQRHLEFNSPYNTYLHTGLPPGPIKITDAACIDSVLNPDDNDYIFMCAKEDFSGLHNFTNSLSEHNRNASRYQTALKKWLREHR